MRQPVKRSMETAGVMFLMVWPFSLIGFAMGGNGWMNFFYLLALTFSFSIVAGFVFESGKN